ncbi:MAG: HAD family hydrolase [Eubacterium sp.]
MYKYILFDLDGTLTDSQEGIINSIKYALKKFDIIETDFYKLKKFLGPPLIDSFKIYYDFSDEAANEAVSFYREYFNSKGIYENKIYNGIIDLLEKLCDYGCKLIVATSKPEPFTFKILDYFDLLKYFTFVAGSNMDNTRKDKEEIIKYVLKNCDINDLSETVMIGDRKHDIIGAGKAGIDSIGVLYGYGNVKELNEAGATHIAVNTDEIYNIITKG